MIANRYVYRSQSVLRRCLSIMTNTPPAIESNALLVSASVANQEQTLAEATTSTNNNVPRVPIPRRGVDYRGKIVLAPMVRSGELPSRLLALHYGADLVWGPETVDRSMIGTTERVNPRTGCIEWTRKQNNGKKTSEVDQESVPDSLIFRIDPKRESDKFIYQIGTANPVTAVQAASLVAPYCSGIDVNAGCPKSFSTSGGMGAALLRTPDLLASILTALVKDVGIPHEIGISVKIRLLETPELTSALVNKLCETGITGLTIHCRTTPMRPRERAIREQLRMIREICHSHGVACLMNGDVASREEGLALAAEYGCDGAMIATAAEANSSVFRSAEQGGVLPWEDVVKQYIRFAISVENKYGNTKFLLSQLMPGKHPLYAKVAQTKRYVQLLELLEITDDDMKIAAEEVDKIMGLDESRVTKSDIKRMHKQAAQANREKKQQQQQQAKKRKMEQNKLQQHQDTKKNRVRSRSPASKETRMRSRSPVQKATIAAENAGFEGIGEGALAVAV